MNYAPQNLNKVPLVTLSFWVVKILATTLGETAGDALSMSLDLGYAISSLIFAALFAGAVFRQIKSRTFHPLPYWCAVVASTTLGTTLADFADRSLGIGYAGGSLILLLSLCASLLVWKRATGSVSVNTVNTPRVEAFYWVTILFSQTLGTALGDWMADTNNLGYEYGALVFAAGLTVVTACYFWTHVSRTALFWAAFILTRPLGATLGDLLDKPVEKGGFAMDRFLASFILAALMVACLLLTAKRPPRPQHN